MDTFWEWLAGLNEDRQKTIAPEILTSYDTEIRSQLERLAQQIDDPGVRKQFQAMIDCGIIDSTGRCRSWASYVVGALLKQGISSRYDLEDSLQYVMERMLMNKGNSGEERSNLFTDFNASRPDSPEHFRARFLLYVKYAVNGIRAGKIHRLAGVQRPPNTLSIGQGRWKSDDPTGDVSPEAIPQQPSTATDLGEMIADIEMLLRKKEPAYGIELGNLFQAIMSGQNSAQQRALFGDRKARLGRQIIIQTIEDYGKSTNNYSLLKILQRLKDFQSGQGQATPPALKPTRPILSDQDRDFQSIVAVIDKFGSAGSSQLGTARRRWLEYPPRNPASGFRNRLEEVLDQMVRQQVLVANRTAKGAFVYAPGPNFSRYRQGVAV